MANLRITPVNLADDASLSTSLAVSSTLGVINLQSDMREAILETLDTSVIDIKLTWATPQTATMFGLGRHNLTTSATAQPIFYTDAAWTTLLSTGTAYTAYNPTGLSAYEDRSSREFKMLRNSDFYFASPGSFQSALIRITDTGNTDGVLRFSRLFMGLHKELFYNPFFNGGLQFTPMPMARQVRTRGGSLTVDKRSNYMSYPIVLDWVKSATDQADLLAINRRCGIDKTLWLSVTPGANDYIDVYTRGPMKFTSIAPMTPWLITHSKTQLTLEGL